MNEQHLQALWHEHFPLAKAMDVSVHSFADHTLVTHTPLPPNTNIHGSAFAGSLYAIQALTAWGLLYLELDRLNLNTSIIHAAGQINFAAPVNTDIVAVSSLQGSDFDPQVLRQTGKIRLQLQARVYAAQADLTPPQLAEQQPASTFSGDYLARVER